MKKQPLSVGAQLVGTVCNWTPRNFGFIKVAAAENVFVHSTGLLESHELRVGDRVRFVVGEDRQGRLCATCVSLLERDDPQQWTPNLTTRHNTEKDNP